MSEAPSSIRTANWVRAYVRRVVGHSIRKTRSFALLNFEILFRPTRAGANIVLDDDPVGLLHALKYYSKMFALSFMIVVIANRFQLYEGNSEWRSLVTIVVQLIIAISIIYVLCLVLPERVPLLRIIQAALYVDGAFLIVEAALSIPISYLAQIVPSENRELDIFANEYGRCLFLQSRCGPRERLVLY